MEDISELVEQVERVMRGLAVPPDPVDGDCLIWEPRVTAALRGAGWDASGVAVIGWLGRGAGVMAYLHRATLLGGHLVIDATARQFNPGLPRVWVSDLPAYCGALAAATGVAEVSIDPPTAGTRPSATERASTA